MAFCNNCGVEHDGGGRFCDACNSNIPRLKLSFNEKYTYFQGTTRPLEFILENIDQENLFNVELTVSCKEAHFSQTKKRRVMKTGKGKPFRFNFPCPHDLSGFAILDLRLNYQDIFQKTHARVAETDINICSISHDSNSQIINIQSGGDVRLIKSDIIESGQGPGISYQDQKLQKERRLPDNWQELDLEKPATDLFISHRPDFSCSDTLMFIDRNDDSQKIYLSSKDNLVLGRPADVVPEIPLLCHPYNPSDPNDQSLRISRKQMEIVREDGSYYLINHATPFSLGCSINDRRLDTGEKLELKSSFIVNVSLLIDLAINANFASPDHPPVSIDSWREMLGEGNFASLASQSYQASCRTGISNVRLRISQCQGDRTSQEVVSLVGLRDGIGSSSDLLRDPRQTAGESFAFIYHVAGAFFLHVLDSGISRIVLEGDHFEPGEIRQLRAGMTLVVDSVEYQILKPQWKMF